MTAIRIEGIDDVRTFLAGLAGDMPKVNEKSQNGLAIEIWKAWRDHADDSFRDGATPFTRGSINYKKFNVPNIGGQPANHQGAMVAIIDRHRGGIGKSSGPDQHYLSVMDLGGPQAGPKASVRRFRAMGIIPDDYVWAPARHAPKDRYGNLKGSDLSDMFTSLGIGFVQTDNPKYRYIWAGGDRPVGVARKKRNSWNPYLWFVPEPTYSGGNVDWTGTAEAVVESEWERIVTYYLDRALAGRL